MKKRLFFLPSFEMTGRREGYRLLSHGEEIIVGKGACVTLSLTDEEKRCIIENISLGFAMQMSDWMPEFFVCIDACLKLALEKAYEKF